MAVDSAIFQDLLEDMNDPHLVQNSYPTTGSREVVVETPRVVVQEILGMSPFVHVPHEFPIRYVWQAGRHAADDPCQALPCPKILVEAVTSNYLPQSRSTAVVYLHTGSHVDHQEGSADQVQHNQVQHEGAGAAADTLLHDRPGVVSIASGMLVVDSH